MGAKFTADERAEAIAKVESLYLSGYSQREIGQRVGVSRQQIGKYLRKLREIWLERSGESKDSVVARELARIDRLEREYWRAWERSQKDAETAKQRVVGEARLAELVKKGQAGDPRFLDGVRWCIEQRLKITGAYAPARVEIRDWRAELEKQGVDASEAFERMVAAAAEAIAGTDGSGGDSGGEAAAGDEDGA